MFCTRFKQGERVFLLSVSRCGISRRQAHVRGVTRSEGGIWNYELVFGECFPFQIIGEIPAWLCKNDNYGKKLLPTRIQNWTRNFCALFVKLNVDNQYTVCLTHPTREALRKPCSRSAQVFHLCVSSSVCGWVIVSSHNCLACRTGVIFCVNRGESEASASGARGEER